MKLKIKPMYGDGIITNVYTREKDTLYQAKIFGKDQPEYIFNGF